MLAGFDALPLRREFARLVGREFLPSGSEIVGVGGTETLAVRLASIADSLNAINLADYTALRAYAGSALFAYVTGYLVSSAPSGVAGVFTRDTSDTTSTDNGGTTIVASNGIRWKRQHQGTVTADQFEADYSGATNASTRLQAMIDWCQDNDVWPLLHPYGTYKLTTGLTFKHGKSGVDTRSYHPRLKGNSSTLRPVGAITGVAVVPRCTLADAATGRGVARTDIDGIFIDGALATVGGQGLKIGLAGYDCDSFDYSEINNVVLTTWTGYTAAEILECRHIRWGGLIARTGSVIIHAETSGSFCGDQIFEGFDGAGTVSSRPLNITVGAGAQVRGLKFNFPVIYGSGAIISCTTSGMIGDIWFQSPQWDAQPYAVSGEHALEIVSTGATGQIFQVHIRDPYVVGYTGTPVYVHAAGGGTIRQSDMHGGGINNCTTDGALGDCMVLVLGTQGFDVEGTQFDSITGATANAVLVSLDTTTNCGVRNIKATRSSSIKYGVAVGNSSDKYVITGNQVNATTAAVNDYTTGSPTRLVTDNLLI